jgi:hypothetical protein
VVVNKYKRESKTKPLATSSYKSGANTERKLEKADKMQLEFERVQAELEANRRGRDDPKAFYQACVDYYRDGSQRHSSPTTRLVD